MYIHVRFSVRRKPHFLRDALFVKHRRGIRC